MESGNRLTVVRGEEGGGDWLMESEGISQRTYIHEGPMNMDNGVGIDYGSDRVGWMEECEGWKMGHF